MDSPDCVGYFRFVSRDERPRDNTWLAWFNAKLGLVRQPPTGILMNVHFVDRATGDTRHELPRFVGHPPRLSPDGRWFACRSEQDGIEVWDTYPPVRWRKALLAGLAAASGVLALAK
jgi:hypothetical protein